MLSVLFSFLQWRNVCVIFTFHLPFARIISYNGSVVYICGYIFRGCHRYWNIRISTITIIYKCCWLWFNFKLTANNKIQTFLSFYFCFFTENNLNFYMLKRLELKAKRKIFSLTSLHFFLIFSKKKKERFLEEHIYETERNYNIWTKTDDKLTNRKKRNK